MKTTSHATAVCLLGIAVCLTGCGNDATTTTNTDPNPPPETVDGHQHPAHPEEGPHHGHLIELGNEEYHAELLHDDQSVTIYILDRAAAQQVAISATEIMINSTSEGRPQQFTLAATAEEDDPPGTSSRFVSQDPALVAHLQRENLQARLALTIQGKSYRGLIEHQGGDHEH